MHGAPRAVPRQDSRDLGNLPDHLVPLSLHMMNVLRRDRKGLWTDSSGWVSLRRLLQLNRFAHFSCADIETVVQESYSKSRPRFEMQSRFGEIYVRAAHKRIVELPAVQVPHMAEGVDSFPVQVHTPGAAADVRADARCSGGDVGHVRELDGSSVWSAVSSWGQTWDRYENPQNGVLWHCAETSSFFIETAPTP